MRLLFVIHYCSPDVNDNALGPIYLGEVGHEVLVISSKYADSLKGKVQAKEHEVIGNTEFYRPYPEWLDVTNKPWSHWDEVVEKVDKFHPEVIIGFGEFNYRLSLALSKRYSIPYILYVEYLNPLKFSIPIRGRTLLKRVSPFTYKMLSKAFLCYLKRNVAAIMYAYYGGHEYAKAVSKNYGHVYYVPWCTDVGRFVTDHNKEKDVGIYIGSLEVFKNSEELLDMIPVILERTETKKFIVVGPGALAVRVKKLKNAYGARLEYRESVTRDEALRLISSSSYGFTTVKDCGLGFIGDCWGVKTPLVSMYDLDGFLKDNEDCLIANAEDELVAIIDNLLGSDELCQKIAGNGKHRHDNNYTAKAVGDNYLKVINQVIN